MNKVMTWVKANIAIVALCVVILLVLPAGWVAGSMWNKSIRTDRQRKVDEADSNLKGVERIKYSAPAVAPDEQPLEYNYAPNEKLIALFEQIGAEQGEQVKSVVKLAEDLNSRGHAPLVEGLFPQPAESERQAKVLAFMGALVPTKDPANPSAYERLLASVGAGEAPDPKVVLQSLVDARQRERDRLTASGSNAEPPEAEQKAMNDALVGQRLSQYKARAEQVSVYGSMDMFPKFAPETAWPQIPDTRLAVPPTVERCFVWQCDFWTVQDVLGAVKLANTGAGGRSTMVPESVVKRIISLSLGPPAWAAGAGSGDSSLAAPADPRSTVIPPSYAASITGRVGGKASALYDVRRAQMSVVVSLQRMPQFFNAIAKANFMTVVGLNLRPVNITDELDAGFYYGQEAVVRADLEIECVWLRTWTVPYMPDSIKQQLGIPVEEAPADSGGTTQPNGGKSRGGR